LPSSEHHTTKSGAGKKRPFVGRTDLIELFNGILQDKVRSLPTAGEGTRPTVLVFHGVAGIGKTTLYKRLVEELKVTYPAAIWSGIDFRNPSNLEFHNAMLHLREELKSKHKVKFRSFDLAYAVYWKKAYPQIPLTNEDFPRWDWTGLLAGVIAAAAGVPVAGFIQKITEEIPKSHKQLSGWWTKRAEPILRGIPELQEHQILELLPGLLAADIKHHIAPDSLPVVLFFDTYETLQGERPQDSIHAPLDNWVQQLVSELPQALCVITGREELRWAENDKSWKDCLHQHKVFDLDKDDAVKYLTDCGVESEEIREVIFEGSKGVPFYLELSVDDFDGLRAEGKEPCPTDFGRTYREILVKFTEHRSEVELRTLRVISTARGWDRSLFELLVKEFDTGFSIKWDFDNFHRFSFISSSSATTRSMHELMREHLQDYLQQNETDRYTLFHKFLFEHYDSQLESIDIRNITEKHHAAIEEAFYHKQHPSDIPALYDWMIGRAKVFYDAAQWQTLVRLYLQMIQILEDSSKPEDLRTATSLNNLAFLYENQAKYDQAEPLCLRALEIREKLLGPEHPVVATSFNNLAALYDSQAKYDQAEPLYKRSLEISEKQLGPEHPDVALSLNNLAALYDSQARYDRAEPLYRRSLEIRKKKLGPEHPDVAASLNNLALLYKSQAKYDQAEPLFKRSLEIMEKQLGPKHPDVAISLLNLGAMIYKLNRKEDAVKMVRRGYRILRDSLGAGHPKTKAALCYLKSWGVEPD